MLRAVAGVRLDGRQAWLLAIGPGTAGQWFSAASRLVPPARHGDRCWL